MTYEKPFGSLLCGRGCGVENRGGESVSRVGVYQLDVSFDIVLLPPPPLTSHIFDLTFDSKFDSGLRVSQRDRVIDRGTVSETA